MIVIDLDTNERVHLTPETEKRILDAYAKLEKPKEQEMNPEEVRKYFDWNQYANWGKGTDIGEFEKALEEVMEGMNMMATRNNTQAQEARVTEVKGRKLIVGSIDGNGTVSFAIAPATHDTQQSAMAEAERLAKLTPGKHYIVAQYVAGVVVQSANRY